MWVERDGTPTVIRATQEIIAGINLSPDGADAVYHDENGSLWTFDMVRADTELLLPLAPDVTANAPVWNADGRTVTFGWNRDGNWDIYEIDVGTRAIRSLLTKDADQFPGQWSANGEVLVYFEDHPDTGMDVWVLPSAGEPVALAASESNEFSPVISPGGDLVAYVSDQSGQHEVYVQTYPGRQVEKASIDGGEEPRWSRNESKLFFTQGYQVMEVTITTDPDLRVTSPESLFTKAFERGSTNPYARPYYDVAPDGRFLMVSDRPTTEFKLIVNWFEELKERVPTGGSQ